MDRRQVLAAGLLLCSPPVGEYERGLLEGMVQSADDAVLRLDAGDGGGAVSPRCLFSPDVSPGMSIRYAFMPPDGWVLGTVVHRYKPHLKDGFWLVLFNDGQRLAVKMTACNYMNAWVRADTVSL
jgi:hypothetical protein